MGCRGPGQAASCPGPRAALSPRKGGRTRKPSASSDEHREPPLFQSQRLAATVTAEPAQEHCQWHTTWVCGAGVFPSAGLDCHLCPLLRRPVRVFLQKPRSCPESPLLSLLPASGSNPKAPLPFLRAGVRALHPDLTGTSQERPTSWAQGKPCCQAPTRWPCGSKITAWSPNQALRHSSSFWELKQRQWEACVLPFLTKCEKSTPSNPVRCHLTPRRGRWSFSHLQFPGEMVTADDS